ncbi:transmembrane emp24 domain-containing protein 7 [Galendromus occidentalis]|uniref:Transmembrane emp24 domain-containing protein 7 n=1 Tax=Galendromus occidentalis TaxID=34638 RepID=A0AAJ6VVL5_9ACAR|nr:transmembrane emp24 domain-containing protein 7 [Galendromus occidentalis]
MLSSVLVLLGLSSALAVELTFELPDNANQCFFEEVKEGTKVTIEYQVIIGGNYDVDISVHGPDKVEIYKQQQKQFDTIPFKAQKSGVYSACFSNEFSTFSHKLVYMSFQVGEEAPIGQDNVRQSAMTKMEDSMTQIHKNLNTVDDYQTHHRLRELHGRKIAEDLNSEVMWYSAVESFGIITIFLSYVMIMKSFFSDKKSIR